MTKFSRLTVSVFKTKHIKGPLRHSYEVLAGLFAADNREDQWVRAVLGLIHSLLSENGSVSGERIEIVRRLIEAKRGTDEAARRIKMLKDISDIPPGEAAAALEGMKKEELEKLIRFLVLLTLTVKVFNEENRKYLADFVAAVGLEQSVFERLIVSAKAEKNAQEHLLRSGAGLIAALGVIAVFILTATLLRSVIFGLIGAYLLLPVEKFFEGSIKRKGLFFYFVRAVELFFWPLNKLTSLVKRHNPFGGGSISSRMENEKKIIKQAVSLTLFVTVLVITGIASGVCSLTRMYVSQQTPMQKTQYVQTADGKLETGRTGSGKWLVSKLRQGEKWLNVKIENDPRVRQFVDFVKENLEDEKTRNELVSVILRYTGGVVNFTAGLVGSFVAVISDVVLSIFFGLLFLLKLAEFCSNDSGTARQSEYLVRTVFNGKWLPDANENTISEAKNILTGTFARLRIWVKGYGTLILIDSLVYSCLFFILEVPYFPVFGLISGCGILLPYLGPIFCCLTALTGAVVLGGASGSQILILLVCYLIYSGIIEQFILYPAVIGESLGLTSLETVIVVLLGAVFAGIAGMIFALPAASVIKYIVPQIYRCWGSPFSDTGNRK